MDQDPYHVIQPVLAPDYGRPEALYRSAQGAAPGFVGQGPWKLGQGTRICTNTYVNSLYLATWRQWAELGRIGVRVTLSEGAARVSVHAVDAQGMVTTLESRTVTPAQGMCWIAGVADDTVRLFLTLDLVQDSTLQDLGWATDRPPVAAPDLTVGLCTFNRESHLAQTLQALITQKALTPAIRQVFVVNQGPDFRDPALRALCAHPGITLITQPNLGGCGGFTRSMVEALQSAAPASHHLLMDDDICLDPRMLDRVLRFLAHVPRGIAVGAQMLEIERPLRLHEAGGRLHALGQLESLGHGLDLDDPASLTLFDTAPQIDYHAWWFCVIPLDAIRRIGLPPPLFIRGDDIEYGFRLGAHGIPSIPLPGCAVWHEGFVHKSSDWLNYYYIRNLLIVASLHPGRFRYPDALYLLGLLMTVLLQHRYRAAEIMIHSIADSLAPPEQALGPDSARRHQRLMAWIATLPAPETLDSASLPASDAGEVVPLNPSIPAMVWMSVSTITRLHLVRLLPRRRPLRFDHTPPAPSIGTRDYLVALDREGSRHAVHRSDLRQLWRLLFMALRVCGDYLRRAGRVQPRNAARIRTSQGLDHWQRQFSADRDP